MSNYCFGCGPDNPFGLHLHFTRFGEDGVQASFVCEDRHVGWPGLQHGGITGAILDEASGYVPYGLGLVTVTAELNVSFVAPIRVGEVLHITAKPTKRNRRLLEVDARIVTEANQIKAKSWSKLVVLSKEQQAAAGIPTIPPVPASFDS